MNKVTINCALIQSASERYLLASRASVVGDCTLHSVVTKDREFALSVYEHALDIGEPDLAAVGGVFTVEWLSSLSEAEKVLADASGRVFRA